MTDQVIDTKVVVDNPTDTSPTDDQFLTWDELSTLTTQKLYIAKYKKWVEFLSFVPLEDMAELQAKYMANNKKDYLGYSLAVLQAVMVNPPLKTIEAARSLKRADSGVLFEIVGRVVSTQEAEAIEENLGND